MAQIAQDVEKRINDMYNKQQQSQLGQLRQSRDKAIGNINNQKQETSASYYDKRNQADVVNLQNQRATREQMASTGLGRSGENISAQVGLGAARQQALGGLNRQEQSTLGQFNQQITQLNDPSREQSIVDTLSAQRSQALRQALEKARQEEFAREQWEAQQEAQRRAEEFSRQRFDWEKKMQQEQLALSRQRSSGGGGGGGGGYAVQSAPRPVPQQNINVPHEELFWAEQLMKDKQERSQPKRQSILRPFTGTTAYFNKMQRLAR